jgi:hypothetical protein
VGLLGDADKTVEVYVAKRRWPYEVNPPGRNKFHIIDSAVWYGMTPHTIPFRTLRGGGSEALHVGLLH